MCGEKTGAIEKPSSGMGSPPRVRGKDTSSNPVQNRVRITPACAGKSSASRKTAGTFWDHPRVCGEKMGYIAGFSRIVGSPPRVRGKDRRHREAIQWDGITPACAGKS